MYSNNSSKSSSGSCGSSLGGLGLSELFGPGYSFAPSSNRYFSSSKGYSTGLRGDYAMMKAMLGPRKILRDDEKPVQISKAEMQRYDLNTPKVEKYKEAFQKPYQSGMYNRRDMTVGFYNKNQKKGYQNMIRGY